MKYGLMELTQYEPTKGCDMSKFDELKFESLPRKLNKQSLLDTVQRNWIALDVSLTRLACRGQTYRNLPDVAQLPKLIRNIQGVYLDQFFPGWDSHPNLWPSKATALLKHPQLQLTLHRLIGGRRFGAMEFVQRPGVMLTPNQAAFLEQVWTTFRMDVPTRERRVTSGMGFYLFTSSLGKRKTDTLKAYSREFRQMLVLVADDLPLDKTIALANRIRCRATLDVARVRNEDGKRVLRTDPLIMEMRRTWADNPGSTGYAPVVFNSSPTKWDRVVAHYTRPVKMDYVLHDGTKGTKLSTVDCLKLIQLES